MDTESMDNTPTPNDVAATVAETENVPADMEESIDTPAAEPDTFPREYVEKLRRENQTMRTRAHDRDALAKELFSARIMLDGRLSDPEALSYSSDLDSPRAVEEAITLLLAKHPGLGSRAVSGDIGQGRTVDNTTPLIEIIKAARGYN